MDDIQKLLNIYVVNSNCNEFTKPVISSVSVDVYADVADLVRTPVFDYSFVTKIALQHSLIDWYNNTMK